MSEGVPRGIGRFLHNKPNTAQECCYLATEFCTQCGWYDAPPPLEAYRQNLLQLIVAGDVAEFNRWCYTYGVSRQSSRRVRFVRSIEQDLQGLPDKWLLRYYGSYDQRPDLKEINAFLATLCLERIGQL